MSYSTRTCARLRSAVASVCSARPDPASIAQLLWRYALALIILSVASGVGPASSARADFRDALEAYDGGDYAQAFREWSRLAEAGDARAQIAVGGMLVRGEGIRQDVVAGTRWYLRAAQQNDAIAQLNLGDLYRSGTGVPADLADAYFWYGLAARAGNRTAKSRFSGIRFKLPSAERQRLDTCIERWAIGRDASCR